MIFQKRGISEVIAVVFLILLAIVAVGIIAAWIVPWVTKSLEDNSKCQKYADYFKFAVEEGEGYNCYNSTTDGHILYVPSIKIERGGESLAEEVIGFELYFSRLGNTKQVVVLEGNATSSNSGGIRMLNRSLQTIEIPKYVGEVFTYVYNTTELYTSVKVAPKLKGKTCPVTDSLNEFFRCEEGWPL